MSFAASSSHFLKLNFFSNISDMPVNTSMTLLKLPTIFSSECYEVFRSQDTVTPLIPSPELYHLFSQWNTLVIKFFLQAVVRLFFLATKYIYFKSPLKSS